MLNFLSNVFEEKSSARTVCGEFSDVLQACAGCDGDCLYTCGEVCGNSCQGETQDTGGDGGYTCNYQCYGSCFSIASIFGIK